MLAIDFSKISWLGIVRNILARWRIFGVICFASLILSGCVDYDVGVNFESQTHGEIVQHIRLGEQLTSFSGATIQEWQDSLKTRAKQLGGKTKRLSERELIVMIPFYNGAELEEKFNNFFNPVDSNQTRNAAQLSEELPQIESRLSLTQNNWLLGLRNRLIFDLDLRSLGVVTSSGNVLMSPGSLIDVRFSIHAPWGVRSLDSSVGEVAPEKHSNQVVWALKPGEINHVEAIFWVPSPIGIGAVFIILLVALGGGLKYRLLPKLGIGKPKKAVNKAAG